MLTEDESRHAVETDWGYVIVPEYASWPMREPRGHGAAAGLSLHVGHERPSG